MTRTRAVIVAVALLCVAVVALIVATSPGSDDGPRAFMASDETSVLLIEWARVGDDGVSGSLTQARVTPTTPGLLADNRLLGETAGGVTRDSTAFTGTINGDSVRLRLAAGALAVPLNGQLDGDALKLVVPQDRGPQTIRLTPASRRDFDAVAARFRATETRRAGQARTTREQADAKTRAAITRVATAYQRALAPRSPDDPCRHMSTAAKAAVVADPAPGAPAGSCKAIVRFYERQDAATPLQNLGAATIDLRTLVSVPGGSGGNQADGAELRFAAIPNDPIGLVQEDGRWRIAEYR